MQKATEAYNEVITGLKEKLEQEEGNIQSKIRSIAKEYERVQKEELKEKGLKKMISELTRRIDCLEISMFASECGLGGKEVI
jgi:polyhydroxyalkanoate synthesis regulator phasin